MYQINYYANCGQFTQTFDMAYKTIERVSIPNLKLFGSMKTKSWTKEVGEFCQKSYSFKFLMTSLQTKNILSKSQISRLIDCLTNTSFSIYFFRIILFLSSFLLVYDGNNISVRRVTFNYIPMFNRKFPEQSG